MLNVWITAFWVMTSCRLVMIIQFCPSSCSEAYRPKKANPPLDYPRKRLLISSGGPTVICKISRATGLIQPVSDTIKVAKGKLLAMNLSLKLGWTIQISVKMTRSLFKIRIRDFPDMKYELYPIEFSWRRGTPAPFSLLQTATDMTSAPQFRRIRVT